MKNLIVLATLLFFAHQSQAQLDEYQLLLAEHASSGHLAKQDVMDQELTTIKTKPSQPKFDKAVRSVASKINQKENSLKFINPIIEISTK